MLRKKLTGLLVAALCLLPSLGQAYTINGNLDVRGNIIGGVRRIGETNNLTLSLASGTLKIQCGNADCSTSNPGWITLPSNTAGQMVTYKVTSSPTFGDATAGDSDFVGTGTCSWGTTAAVAWGNAMPLLLVAAHDGSTVVFGMARGPVLTTGASTNIGYQDNCPSSASQNNVIFMTSTNVTSTHANKMAFPIGAVRATKNASDNWTFTALDDGDGIGIFINFGFRAFDMPTGQMGAASGKYFYNNGGTGPTYTAVNYYKYVLTTTGFLYASINLSNTTGGTAGVGAVSLRLALPLNTGGSADFVGRSNMFISESGGTNTFADGEKAGGNDYMEFAYQSTIATGTSLATNADQSSTIRKVNGSIYYQPFGI
jgi:hypothetical protein